MDDRGGDRDRDRERRDGPDGGRGGREGGGPPDTDFLDLEISKVLYGRASSIARVAFEDLLKEAIKERLRKRLGDRILALATLAADELADDVEANLEIEARIAARREARGALDEKIGSAVRGAAGSGPPVEPAAETKRRGRK